MDGMIPFQFGPLGKTGKVTPRLDGIQSFRADEIEPAKHLTVFEKGGNIGTEQSGQSSQNTGYFALFVKL